MKYYLYDPPNWISSLTAPFLFGQIDLISDLSQSPSEFSQIQKNNYRRS